jgi:hypothetical protein
VHYIIERQQSFLAGLKGRRTDDSPRRSAALDKLDCGFILDTQQPIAFVPEPEGSTHRGIKFYISLIYAGLINH